MSECRRLVQLVEDAEGALAFSCKSMEVEHLSKALEMCDAFDYRSDTEAFARDLRVKVGKAVKGIAMAMKKAPRYKASFIDKAVAFCKQFGYDKPAFKALEHLAKKIKGARKTLNEAYDAVDEEGLGRAIKLCHTKGFAGTTYECQLVEDCQVLHNTIRLVNKHAKKAQKECIEDQVRTVVAAAKEIGLRNDLTKPLYKLVDGKPAKFLAEQIRCGLACDDLDRASRAQVKLHDLQFAKGGRDKKVWKCSEVQKPGDWASGNAKKAEGMTCFTAAMLLTPLTKRLDAGKGSPAHKDLVARIKNGFQTVQKCMGQRHSSKMPLRLQELGSDAVMHQKQLPDEFYLAIVKQCTDNPASVAGPKPNPLTDDCLERAVRLLAYCLTVFPPSAELAPFLAAWVRQEPIKSLGEDFNVSGLLARILLHGAVDPTLVPAQHDFDEAGFTYVGRRQREEPML